MADSYASSPRLRSCGNVGFRCSSGSAAGSVMSPKTPTCSKTRASWNRYALSLLFTAAGLLLLAWVGGQAVLWVCQVENGVIEPGVLVLEAITGGLTSVFGFLMLVQVSPSIDAETTSAWNLPDQRTFADDFPRDVDAWSR